MTVFYTGKGDDSKTGILGGGRVEKDSACIDALGDIDELNSSIGIAVSLCKHSHLSDMLKDVQNDLFIISADLASFGNTSSIKGLRSIGGNSVKKLETYIDEIGKDVPELKGFVLPGGSDLGAHLHYSRAIARRAERAVIRASRDIKVSGSIKGYMNRLSSFLFAAALYANAKGSRIEGHPWY